LNDGEVAQDPSLFFNRELSWLVQRSRLEGWRQLSAALQRIKFASIVASNLDEFFMVRVAGLMRDVEDGENEPDLRPDARAAGALVRERARTQLRTP
jgi:polyphosphate kinase